MGQETSDKNSRRVGGLKGMGIFFAVDQLLEDRQIQTKIAKLLLPQPTRGRNPVSFDTAPGSGGDPCCGKSQSSSLIGVQLDNPAKVGQAKGSHLIEAELLGKLRWVASVSRPDQLCSAPASRRFEDL